MANSGYVDERIVQMEFENQQFERNANQSIGTLGKLKRALNLDGAAKGFEELDKATSKGLDLSAIQNGVSAIGEKFSMMGILGITAMQRISNAAIDMAENLGKTLLGLNGINEGFSRYAEKSGHVKTIMTATGESIEHVSEVLDDLNWFTDETSYRFTDMVNTMGKFTSAGVKLDVAKEAVEGIALWAAESGQNAQTASRAMFQLAQAYGRGTIQLQDWMSVEQANMSTSKIQNELIKEGGEVAEAAIKKYGGFRDSLRSGWLTTETFNKVMQKYSEGVTEANYANGKFTQGVTEMSEAAFRNAQEARTYKDAIEAVEEAVSTGWSHTFEIIFGNAVESAVIWTDLANTLIEVADKFTAFRNDVLEVWSDLGGRDSAVQAAYNMFAGIGRIGRVAGKSFSEALHLSKTVEELQEQEWASTEEGAALFDELRENQEALNRALINGGSAEYIEELRLAIDDSMNSLNAMDRGHILKDISDKILEFSESFKYANDAIRNDKFKEIRDEIARLTKIYNSLGGFENSVRRDAIAKQIEALSKSGDDLLNFEAILQAFTTTYESFTSVISLGKEVFTGVMNGLKPIFNVLSRLVEPIAVLITVINEAFQAITRVVVQSGVISGTLERIGTTIANFISPVVDFIVDKLYEIIEAIDKFTYNLEFGMSPLPGLFEDATKFITGFFDAINTQTISTKAVGIFAKIQDAFKGFLEFIKPVTDAIKQALSNVYNDIKIAIENLSFKDIVAGIGSGGAIMFFTKLKEVIDKVLAILPGGKKSSDVGKNAKGFFDNIKEGVEGLLNTVKRTANVAALLEMAAAIGVIALSISRLAAIPAEDIAKAFGAITEVFLELFGFLYIFDKITKGSKTDFKDVGIGMFLIASSIKKLGKVIESLSNIEGDKLKNAILTIGAVLLELVGFKFLMDKIDKAGGGFKVDGIIKMAAGLLIMSFALQKIGDMEWEQIGKGLAGVGGVLLELVAFQYLLNKVGGANGMAEMGAGMILIGTSMLIFAQAIKSIGKLDLNVMSQGLTGMAVVLVEMVAALRMLEETPVIKIAAGMLILSVALAAIAGVVALLGQFKIGTITKGLVALAGMVIIIGATLAGMSDFTNGGHGLIAAAGAILIVAAALTMLTVPLLILGQMNLGQVLTALLALGGVLAIMGAAAVLLQPLAGTLLAIAAAAFLFGAGMLAFGAGLTLASASLVAFCTSLVASITIIIGGIGTILAAVVLALAEFGGSIAMAIALLGKAILDGLTMLVEPLVNLVITTIETIAVALAEHSHVILGAVADFLSGIILAIAWKLPDIIDAAIKLAIAFVNGVAFGLMNNTDAIFAALDNLINAIGYFAISGLQEIIKGLVPFGDQVAGMLDGVKEQMKANMDAAQAEAQAQDFTNGIVETLNNRTGEVNEAGGGLASAGIEGFISKGEEFKNSGQLMAGMLNDGLFGENSTTAITESSNGLVDTFVTSLTGDANMSNVAKAGADLSKEGADSAGKNRDEWVQTGINLGDGIGSGLENSEMIQRVCRSAVNLVEEAIAAANRAGGIESPSKETKKTGKFLVLGVVSGINEFSKVLDSSSEKLIDGAVTTIGTAIMSIYDSVSTGAEVPIRPVIDLDNFSTNDINRISSLLDSNSIESFAKASISVDAQNNRIDELVTVANRILGSIQNGSDLYLDDRIIAGRINRRLGSV